MVTSSPASTPLPSKHEHDHDRSEALFDVAFYRPLYPIGTFALAWERDMALARHQITHGTALALSTCNLVTLPPSTRPLPAPTNQSTPPPAATHTSESHTVFLHPAPCA
ncbi:hypothetical protein MAPG_07952 [Magnaporthiopsis poae ATCC 64411]|uniref:Uncharacterized protein n=1 Tax=Magnaporthiopsis poae (strain ATCC 64411 / 73-15) TaxID=644358 RepID=A0A0C4E622_MAGP6|nr:hypothetical protein MAPG_07952 [Magnaporthiopsis poae ATCC 64411]